MKLRILGSAAAEAVPGFFCECPACCFAREHGGRDLRRRTSYLLDSDTLIDCGPDFNWQCNEFKIDPLALERILITHSHRDHLSPFVFLMRRAGFSAVTKTLPILADAAAHEQIRRETETSYEEMHLKEIRIAPGDTVHSGDLSVFAVRASHSPETTPLNFFLERDGKRILIQNDSGWWTEESWAMAAEHCRNKPLDLVVIEATFAFGNPEGQDHHLGNHASVRFRDRLKELGLVTDRTVCVVNHFSHNGLPLHADMMRYFAPFGIIPAYDGMEIVLP